VNHITTQPSSSTGIICALPSLSNIDDTFILDTGATDHVCQSLNFFQCMKKIKPINIKLPNDVIVTTSFASTILFDKNLYITDVLYFLDFSFNLIYVPKLTKNLNYFLMFDGMKCLIQDTLSKKMIGVADLDHGLYTLLLNPELG
jgi:hypothetical protein